MLERTIPLVTTVKYLLLYDVIEAVLEILRIRRVDAEKLKFTFLCGFVNVKARSMISITSFNCAKSDLVLLFFMFPALTVSFTVLIIFPVYLVIGLLISFLCFFRRDDGILKMGGYVTDTDSKADM